MFAAEASPLFTGMCMVLPMIVIGAAAIGGVLKVGHRGINQGARELLASHMDSNKYNRLVLEPAEQQCSGARNDCATPSSGEDSGLNMERFSSCSGVAGANLP